MMYRKLLSSKHLAADDFVDAEFRPVERVLTLSGVRMGKPPMGKVEKAEFAFSETEKTAFFSNGDIKAIARLLRRADTTQWVGAKIAITSEPRKMAGQATTGMKIVRAWFEKQAIQGATDGQA
jgi:hypothetical protein